MLKRFNLISQTTVTTRYLVNRNLFITLNAINKTGDTLQHYIFMIARIFDAPDNVQETTSKPSRRLTGVSVRFLLF